MNLMGGQTVIDGGVERVMLEGAKNALKVVLALNEGESLLIVTDEHKSDIASVDGGTGRVRVGIGAL
jgi:hypothetical protein